MNVDLLGLLARIRIAALLDEAGRRRMLRPEGPQSLRSYVGGAVRSVGMVVVTVGDALAGSR